MQYVPTKLIRKWESIAFSWRINNDKTWARIDFFYETNIQSISGCRVRRSGKFPGSDLFDVIRRNFTIFRANLIQIIFGKLMIKWLWIQNKYITQPLLRQSSTLFYSYSNIDSKMPDRFASRFQVYSNACILFALSLSLAFSVPMFCCCCCCWSLDNETLAFRQCNLHRKRTHHHHLKCDEQKETPTKRKVNV